MLLRSRRASAPGARPSMSLDVRRDQWKVVVGAALLTYALVVTYLSQGEGSGFIKMTLPARPVLATNPLIGYSVTYDGAPLFKENIPAIQEVLWYNGADA